MQGFFRPLTTWIWICPSSLPAEAQGRGVGSSRLSPAVDGLGEFVQQATVTWLHLESAYFLELARDPAQANTLRSSCGLRGPSLGECLAMCLPWS